MFLGNAGSPVAGFLRFLRLLSNHPWAERPLFVDPEGEMTADARREASADFRKVSLCLEPFNSDPLSTSHPTLDLFFVSDFCRFFQIFAVRLQSERVEDSVSQLWFLTLIVSRKLYGITIMVNNMNQRLQEFVLRVTMGNGCF
jgi:hypothetical protein